MSRTQDKVVVGRKWNSPAIYAHVDGEGIELSLDLANFLFALAAEVGNPTLLLTRAQLQRALTNASTKVLAEVKRASVEVI